VLLTRRAAEAAIPSLMGMGLDYSPALDRHDAQRKIGVITRAEIVGRVIEVGGFLYARDFPEIVAEIGRPRRTGTSVSAGGDRNVRASRAGLGMSYEITDALVEDIKASVWVLNRVTFTGAAVLRRDKAAYCSTWIELG
jgi:transposase